MAGETKVAFNPNSAFEAFKALTVGRDHNKGALEVRVENGQQKLACVNHRFWNRLGYTEKTGAAGQRVVRALLSNAVNAELDKILSAVRKNGVAQGLEIGEIDDKIGAIKASFENAIKFKGESGVKNSDVLLRKDIKKIVEDVSMLKEKLTIGSLMEMSVKDLVNLSTNTSAQQEAERLQNARPQPKNKKFVFKGFDEQTTAKVRAEQHEKLKRQPILKEAFLRKINDCGMMARLLGEMSYNLGNLLLNDENASEKANADLRQNEITAFTFDKKGRAVLDPTASDEKVLKDFEKLVDLCRERMSPLSNHDERVELREDIVWENLFDYTANLNDESRVGAE